MQKYLLLSGLICCLACQDNARQTSPSPLRDSLEFSKPITVETNRVVSLLPEAREAINEWLAYATAHNEMEAMKNATGQEIIESSQPLLQIMENLNSSIPEPLQATAVKARTNVLLTKAGVLHQLTGKKNKNAEEVYRTANELITEFDNLKIQLNEQFLKTPEEFELELDHEFEENQQQDTLSAVRQMRQ